MCSKKDLAKEGKENDKFERGQKKKATDFYFEREKKKQCCVFLVKGQNEK